MPIAAITESSENAMSRARICAMSQAEDAG